jgi:hypothetical protein
MTSSRLLFVRSFEHPDERLEMDVFRHEMDGAATEAEVGTALMMARDVVGT